MLFIRYVSDNYRDSGDFAPPIAIPIEVSFKKDAASRRACSDANKLSEEWANMERFVNPVGIGPANSWAAPTAMQI